MPKLPKPAPPPSWIEPCIPTLVEKPPSGPNWRHEVKWDGYRVSLVIDAGAATVRTRRGLDWNDRFQAIVAAAAKIPCRNAVIDGEAVVPDAEGRADFAALQASIGKGGKDAVLYAFDLLFLDGRDLRALRLSERRKALETLIGAKTGAILISELFEGDGANFLKTACAHELEGIVSKRIDSPYRSGRREDWLKTKCVQSGRFVIVGYQPDARGRIANIKVAIEDEGDSLRYVGAVGTGWSESTELALKKRLDAIAVPQAPVEGVKAEGAVWTAPTLRAEIAYRGLTATGELRHASFKGLREDE